MAGQLYALQSDVDMIAIQVNDLTKALNTLDLILDKLTKIEVEQMCIGAQLGRLEERVARLEEKVEKLERDMEKVKSDIKDIKNHLKIP